MDAIADDLDIQVGESDLTERLILMARQYGLEPQQLVSMLQQQNQLPVVYADVRRGLAVAAVVEAATVSDTSGEVIDTTEFFGSGAESADAEASSGAEPKAKKKAAKAAKKKAEPKAEKKAEPKAEKPAKKKAASEEASEEKSEEKSESE